MNRFVPWVGGIVGTAIIGIGGYFAYSYYSNTNNTPEQRDVDSEQQSEERFVPCNGQENVIFEDQILALVIRSTLGLPEQNDSTIPCDELLRLEELRASEKAIFSLVGLENAINLKRVDLSKNILLNTDALSQLPNLESINLTKTNISEFSNISSSRLKYLDLGENIIVSLSRLENFSKLHQLNIYQNSISDFEPLRSLENILTLTLYNNPVDLSPDKQNRQIIQQLIDKGTEVIWDELSLSLGIGSNHSKASNVNVLDIVNLNARVTLNQTFKNDILIEGVEFFEVTPLGAISSVFYDREPPYSYDVAFDESEEGIHQYAAQVNTKKGAFVLTPPGEYVTVNVEKKDKPQCRSDRDCVDDRQCTSDRCVSGKCEHYMQTACSENEEISCSDGKDNNKDGKIDCADPDCAGFASCKESICFDGTDNDKDGKIDCRDSDCSVEATCGEICDNGINDDGDSNVDCNDRRDCADHPSCQGQAQSCNSDVSIVCKEIFAENESQVHCSLRMSIKGNNNCSASIVTCNRDQCWSDTGGGNFDFQGCGSLQTKLQTLPVGTVLTGNAALGLDSTQTCGSLNLCRRIILCE